MLFFAFWLTLCSTNSLSSAKHIFLTLSIILMASIFIPSLSKLLETNQVKYIILPLVFTASIFSFVFGLIFSLSELQVSIRTIAIVTGFLWLIVFLMAELKTIRMHIGLLSSIVVIGIAKHMGKLRCSFFCPIPYIKRKYWYSCIQSA